MTSEGRGGHRTSRTRPRPGAAGSAEQEGLAGGRLGGGCCGFPGGLCSVCGPEAEQQPASPPTAEVLASVSLQKSALIVRGPREVKKRELVFLQFRLNESSEDFSAIDYLLFSSFQEFLHRWPSGVPGGLVPPLHHTLALHIPGQGVGWGPAAGRPGRAPRGC